MERFSERSSLLLDFFIRQTGSVEIFSTKNLAQETASPSAPSCRFIKIRIRPATEALDERMKSEWMIVTGFAESKPTVFADRIELLCTSW